MRFFKLTFRFARALFGLGFALLSGVVLAACWVARAGYHLLLAAKDTVHLLRDRDADGSISCTACGERFPTCGALECSECGFVQWRDGDLWAPCSHCGAGTPWLMCECGFSAKNRHLVGRELPP